MATVKPEYIRNVILNWVSLSEEDRYGNFSLQIEFSKDRIKEMEGYGNCKLLDNGNFGINLSTKAVHGKDTKKAGQRKEIMVIDMNKEPIKALIGNGSVGDLKVITRPAERAYNGKKTYPMALLVKKLIEYVPVDDDFDILEKPSEVANNDNF